MKENQRIGLDPDSIRPQKWAEVVGQDAVVAKLRRHVAIARSGEENFQRFIILRSDYPGVGKTTLTRIFAAALNCHNIGEGQEPCGECSGCHIALSGGGDFSSVTEVDAAQNNGVNEMKEVQRQVMLTSQENWRVLIVDEAHEVTQRAQNSLLKSLEAPSNSKLITIWVTTQVNRIIPTVRSRGLELSLTAVSDSSIADALQNLVNERDLDVKESTVQQISHRSQGSLRTAINLLSGHLLGGDGEDAADSGELSTVVESMARSVVLDSDFGLFLRLADDYEKQGFSLPYGQVLVAINDLLRQEVTNLAASPDSSAPRMIKRYARAISTVSTSFVTLEQVSSPKIVVEGVAAGLVGTDFGDVTRSRDVQVYEGIMERIDELYALMERKAEQS